jgi:thermolysin
MGAGTPARAQARGRITFAARSAIDLRDWGQQLDSMARSGELRTRQQRADPLVAGRTHERADQYYRGVRVFGGNVSRQYESSGLLVSAFGTVYDDIAIDPAPALDAAEASAVVTERAGLGLPTTEPELVVLPLDDGRYTLTWRVKALTTGDLRQYFVDAATGTIVFDYSDLQTQSAAIGTGTGVLGDTKKISVTSGTTFTTTDRKRPPAIITYDMQGNFTRSINIINGVANPTTSDIATDSNNVWTDGSVVDAHVYAGFVYDYYFRRFNRHGLDNADIPIRSLVNPVLRSNANQLFNSFPDLFINAAYLGGGMIFYGVGLPPGQTFGGKSWDFLAGAIDIVGHELTHGVTDYSSGLIYRNESGALNEAFSDIMGTSIEFFYQPPGSGRLQADYLCGEDVVTPNGIRSMSDPQSMNQPDHFSRRVITSSDNGGVHINSGIANNAFYLAIEGGTNRTSLLSVQGVGAANREQIERVFYRAFTQLMPANATFATARAATIQASVDLFGANSAANRAVTQAWTAVGVN